MNKTGIRLATALLVVSTLPAIQACVPLIAATGIGPIHLLAIVVLFCWVLVC